MVVRVSHGLRAARRRLDDRVVNDGPRHDMCAYSKADVVDACLKRSSAECIDDDHDRGMSPDAGGEPAGNNLDTEISPFGL
jgi:hypothetical protein